MWGPRHGTNSLRERTISPRITMIIAYDTSGEVHLSFSQSNTDAELFQLFLFELVCALDKKSRYWRDGTVVLLDGARYHSCPETRVMI
jgi:hypothetical protein